MFSIVMVISGLLFIDVFFILSGMSIDFDWDGVLVGYGEIAIKSHRVRRRFVRKLAINIIKGLRELNVKCKIHHKWSRLLIKTNDIPSTIKLLKKIFGVVFSAPYKFVRLNELDDFFEKYSQLLIGDANSFAIRVKRSGTHPFTSKDLERHLGAIVKNKTGVKVCLDNPEKTVYVEVRGDECYIYNEKHIGPSGLPLGVSGKVVCLISGGIDSPVAAWLMMRRGCSIIPLYAKLTGSLEDLDFKRFIEITKILRGWHIGVSMPIYVYDHEYNLKIFSVYASNYTCILCKRMMYRVANELAKKVNANAIVTGESLAQVASQTLYNLRVIDQVSELPVLRPLIGFNKDESINLAKMIGTYEISCMNLPDKWLRVRGCWARPSKPVTRAKLEKVLELESKINIEELFRRSIESLRELEDDY